jgi:hypothetical protein
MIPVTLQAEPTDFDSKVRAKGLAWLSQNGIAPNGPAPKGTKFKAYWSHSNKQLWDAYSGVCAYLAIYFDWPTGASSTDHFVAKSKDAGQVYEWNNYRLSCLGPNRNKNKYDDVLDPVGLVADTFELILANGQVRPSRSLTDPVHISMARKTIVRLKLDSPDHREMRSKQYARYLRSKDVQTLKELSPFVWYEADRQGLL